MLAYGDAGGEFVSKVFRDMLKEKGTKYGFPITMYTSDPKDYAKNGIVERFNRTLRTLTHCPYLREGI
eukprot:SAG31_NODE_28001_length_416_cov_13.441640_2_plen_68_part_00